MTGIGLWLDAGNRASLSFNSCNVKSWTDSRSKTYTLTQSNTNSQPTYSATAYNSKPGLVFNGTNFLSGSNYTAANFSAPATLCYVISEYTGGLIMFKGNSSYTWAGAGSKKFWMSSTGNNETSRGCLASYVVHSGGYQFTSSVASSNFVVVCAALNSSNNIDYYFNGTLQPNNSTGATDNADNGDFISIGGPSTTNSSPFIGNIHEIVHYNKVLTSAEIKTLSTFLQNKW
jgi:hypothetical protein